MITKSDESLAQWAMEYALRNGCQASRVSLYNGSSSAFEIRDLKIDRLPEIQQARVDCQDYRALAQRYRGFLETHRCEDLVQLIKLVYTKNQRKSRSGKKPGKVDQDYQRRAESLLHGELAAALGIPVEAVPDYIRQRLQLKAEAKKNAG